VTFRGNVLGDDGAPAGLAAFQIDIALDRGTFPCVQLFPLDTTRNGGATCHILDIRTH
jgi:hypothetical protein